VLVKALTPWTKSSYNILLPYLFRPRLSYCFLALSSRFPRAFLTLSSRFPRAVLALSSRFPRAFLALSSRFPLAFLSLSSRFPLALLSFSSSDLLLIFRSPFFLSDTSMTKRKHVYENHANFKALPTMGVVFALPILAQVMGGIPGLTFNPMMLLHGEQYVFPSLIIVTIFFLFH
jgi:hypothetical protein